MCMEHYDHVMISDPANKHLYIKIHLSVKIVNFFLQSFGNKEMHLSIIFW